MTLDEQFKSAAERVHSLTERPDNMILLKLYALFKQATEGDVSGERPGMFDMKGAAKYNAWEQLRGTPADAAKTSYIELVNSLFA
jgi:acyl-CoA-binding protein